jgi:heme exporter protein D
VSALSVFTLVWGIGREAGLPDSSPWKTAFAVFLLALALLEISGIRIRRSLFRRQTPKELPIRYGARLGPFLWGLDTGSVVSTYRVSLASWAALLVVLMGASGPIVGLSYALAFCVPLAVLTIAPTLGSRPSWALAGVPTHDLVHRLLARSSATVLLGAVLMVAWATTALLSIPY